MVPAPAPRLLGALWLALAAIDAHAQSTDPPTAETDAERRGRELYENGALLYDEGRYEDAIVAWQAAYNLTQRSGFLFNIANAYERLAKYDEAIDVLGRYRALAKSEERETLDRRIRNLEERREEKALAPPPARPVPNTPTSPMPDPQPVARTWSVRPIVGYTLVGAGVAGLATGLGFGLGARSAGATAEAGCQSQGTGLLCPSSASEALAANRRSALIADVGFGAGLGLLGTGVVVLVTGGDRTLSVAPRGRGVEVALSW